MGVVPNPADMADRAAIVEVIYRYCRGMDRMDKALTLSCWHDGGTDDHAPLFAGTAAGFVEWLWPVHGAMLATRHVVANILIDLRGDSAGTESYWQVIHRMAHAGRIVDVQAAGRYVDRFEKLGGVWAIRHRQSIRDWSRADDAGAAAGGSLLQPYVARHDPDAPETASRRDRGDYSYSVLDLVP